MHLRRGKIHESNRIAMRKQLYRLHRILSLIIALPVLLWAISGFLHPVMTNVRPEVETQLLQEEPVDSSKVTAPLNELLKSTGADSIDQVRLIRIEKNLYYQVWVGDSTVTYFNASDGTRLHEGDMVYAKYLARKFLGAEQDAVSIQKIEKIQFFSREYTPINRLLPVYRVAFNRADGIVIYVDTKSSSFSFASNNLRRQFSKFFIAIHTWAWIDFLGDWRFIFEMILSGIAFLTAGLGIVLYFSSPGISAQGNAMLRSRRNHRITAITASLFTLLFSFSGCYHAFSKIGFEFGMEPVNTSRFSAAVGFDASGLQKIIGRPFNSAQLAHIDDSVYWRIAVVGEAPAGSDDLMKQQGVAPGVYEYVNASTGRMLSDGEIKHVLSVAKYFGIGDVSTPPTLVTKFTEEYNFADKLLPVWRVESKTGKIFFIDAPRENLSKEFLNSISYEELSFAYLHKHEFLSPIGKGVKDFSTMFWAAMQVVMIIFGLILYFKIKSRNK